MNKHGTCDDGMKHIIKTRHIFRNKICLFSYKERLYEVSFGY
jgi:hypothetical protein